eukprot:comp19177_c0_seq1/m.35762 comp19177_c0_seq1/g.35762  ORF comp19177_c0_seq1/g.35762 comp19177_c0_seq1/m.35762 type:complete len:300 (+) comp19177_c0_seq1:163-1062(+)
MHEDVAGTRGALGMRCHCLLEDPHGPRLFGLAGRADHAKILCAGQLPLHKETHGLAHLCLVHVGDVDDDVSARGQRAPALGQCDKEELCEPGIQGAERVHALARERGVDLKVKEGRRGEDQVVCASFEHGLLKGDVLDAEVLLSFGLWHECFDDFAVAVTQREIRVECMIAVDARGNCAGEAVAPSGAEIEHALCVELADHRDNKARLELCAFLDEQKQGLAQCLWTDAAEFGQGLADHARGECVVAPVVERGLGLVLPLCAEAGLFLEHIDEHVHGLVVVGAVHKREISSAVAQGEHV